MILVTFYPSMSNSNHLNFEKCIFIVWKGFEEGPKNTKTKTDENKPIPNTGKPENIDDLKKDLRNHFNEGIMDHISSRKIPWNLCTQIFKIVVITIQVNMKHS